MHSSGGRGRSEVPKYAVTSDIKDKTGDASIMKLSMLSRRDSTYLKAEPAVTTKAKEMDPFDQDLLAANNKVQSPKETGKDDRDCFCFG